MEDLGGVFIRCLINVLLLIVEVAIVVCVLGYMQVIK